MDWQKKWSEGEWVFSQLIGKIGSQHFERQPKPGEGRLIARLFDLNCTQFSSIVSWQEKMSKELVWIAIHVLQNFVLNLAKPIKKAVILCPFDDDHNDGENIDGSQGRKDDLVEIVRDVFSREWSHKDGPLKEVELEVEIVSVSELEPELNRKRQCIRY